MTVPKWVEVFFASLHRSEETATASAAEDVRAWVGGLPAAAAAGQEPLLSVFLDVKSAGETPARLAALVRGLNMLGVRVWGVGSFVHAQLSAFEEGGQRRQEVRVPASIAEVVRAETPSAAGREATTAHPEGAGAMTQRGRSSSPPLLFPAPIPLRIFSFADAVAAAAEQGKLPRGAHVLFNAGSLFSEKRSGGVWEVDERLLSRLASAVASRALCVGAYTQESHLDAGTAAKMIGLFNDRPDVFALGLSYSGVQGLAASDIPSGNGLPIPGWLRGLVGRGR